MLHILLSKFLYDLAVIVVFQANVLASSSFFLYT